MARFKLRIDG